MSEVSWGLQHPTLGKSHVARRSRFRGFWHLILWICWYRLQLITQSSHVYIAIRRFSGCWTQKQDMDVPKHNNLDPLTPIWCFEHRARDPIIGQEAPHFVDMPIIVFCLLMHVKKYGKIGLTNQQSIARYDETIWNMSSKHRIWYDMFEIWNNIWLKISWSPLIFISPADPSPPPHQARLVLRWGPRLQQILFGCRWVFFCSFRMTKIHQNWLNLNQYLFWMVGWCWWNFENWDNWWTVRTITKIIPKSHWVLILGAVPTLQPWNWIEKLNIEHPEIRRETPSATSWSNGSIVLGTPRIISFFWFKRPILCSSDTHCPWWYDIPTFWTSSIL